MLCHVKGRCSIENWTRKKVRVRDPSAVFNIMPNGDNGYYYTLRHCLTEI